MIKIQVAFIELKVQIFVIRNVRNGDKIRLDVGNEEPFSDRKTKI